MVDRTDPGCKKILDQLRKADVLLVCKLDELSPSLRHVLAIIESWAEDKAVFRRLTETIETITPVVVQ